MSSTMRHTNSTGILALSLALFGHPASASSARAARCLEEGATVRFTGVVSRETFPGVPNFTSVADGDRPETVWVLTVATPRCVAAASTQGGKPEAVVKPNTRYQLVFKDASEYVKHPSIVGRQATVTGQLLIAITGHHHTPVLLEVKSIHKAAPKGR